VAEVDALGAVVPAVSDDESDVEAAAEVLLPEPRDPQPTSVRRPAPPINWRTRRRTRGIELDGHGVPFRPVRWSSRVFRSVFMQQASGTILIVPLAIPWTLRRASTTKAALGNNPTTPPVPGPDEAGAHRSDAQRHR